MIYAQIVTLITGFLILIIVLYIDDKLWLFTSHLRQDLYSAISKLIINNKWYM